MILDGIALILTTQISSGWSGYLLRGRLAVEMDDGVMGHNAADIAINSPAWAPGIDNLSALNWDMVQIQAPEAYVSEGGSPIRYAIKQGSFVVASEGKHAKEVVHATQDVTG
jgi:hypothetical protein